MNYNEKKILRSVKLTTHGTIEVEREEQVLCDDEVRHRSTSLQVLDKSMNLNELTLEPLVVAFAGVAWSREDLAKFHQDTLALVQEEFDKKAAGEKEKHEQFMIDRAAELAAQEEQARSAREKHEAFMSDRAAEQTEREELVKHLQGTMELHETKLARHAEQEAVVKERADSLQIHAKAFETQREMLRRQAVTLQALGAELGAASAELAKAQPIKLVRP